MKQRGSFEEMDDRNYPNDSVGFIHNSGDPNGPPGLRGQMAMVVRGAQRGLAYESHDAYVHVQPESPRPWAHTVTERPKPQGTQLPLPLEGAGAIPHDRDLHRLRQANPHLNSYQFAARGAGRSGMIEVHHPEHGLVGTLSFKADEYSPTHQEIEMIQVHPQHKSRGIAEGMYDYANAKGASLIHSENRSEEGDAFARRVGGPKHPRHEGHGIEKYGTRWEPGK